MEPEDTGDWYDVDLVLKLMNAVVSDSNLKERFVFIDTGDQTVQIIFGPKENTNSGYSGAYVKLLRDKPLKCTYIFKGVVPETKVIIAFPLSFKYHKEGTQSTQFIEDRVLFNDLLIDWK